jgi:hypothetical protein
MEMVRVRERRTRGSVIIAMNFENEVRIGV